MGIRKRISGVVVAQDNESTIRQVLGCLLAVADEIIVVDGGSTDATIDICLSFPKVRLYRRDFDGQHWFIDRPEGMVTIGFQSDALTGLQDNDAAGPDTTPDAIGVDCNVGVCQTLIFGGIVELNDQLATPTIDDVLGLHPMKVQRRDLIDAHDQHLFAVDLAPSMLEIVQGTVA